VSFDREEVLAQATAVFWAHGYGDTSISRLVEATHLQPGSLYAAFESKEGLFLATLDHYAGQTLAHLHATLAAAPDPLQGVRRFVGGLADAEASARSAAVFWSIPCSRWDGTMLWCGLGCDGTSMPSNVNWPRPSRPLMLLGCWRHAARPGRWPSS